MCVCIKIWYVYVCGVYMCVYAVCAVCVQWCVFYVCMVHVVCMRVYFHAHVYICGDQWKAISFLFHHSLLCFL